jgi:serine/threonine protein kinase
VPWSLIVVDGADLKSIFPLPASGRVVVGKDPDLSNLTFNDFYLEKTHCVLEVGENTITVLDTSKERGVYVNGKKVVRKASLASGDVLRVGNTFLRMDPYSGPLPELAGPEEERPATPHYSFKRLQDLQGHTLGRYELGLVLGKGHHGITFRARDVSGNRTVALKVLSPDFPQGPDEVKRFAQVVKTIAPLGEHPHLVRWLGTGKSGPYVWIAQELIDGENLNSIFSHPESARWTWRGAWRVAWEIGHALDHLHKRHVAHGNICAANLLFNGEGSVKLNDLRFRDALEGSVWQQKQLEAKLLGELLYMPPERLEEGAFVDPHVADLYSLGVATFVRLSCGGAPFQAAETSALIDQILAGVSDKHRRRAPAAPEAFLDVVYKMLARGQEDRYQTPAELLRDLEPFRETR